MIEKCVASVLLCLVTLLNLAVMSSAACSFTTQYGWCNPLGQMTCRFGWVNANNRCMAKHPCRTCVCKNGGTCVPQGAEGYRCVCPAGYSGANCETCSAIAGCSVHHSSLSCEICSSCTASAATRRPSGCPEGNKGVVAGIGIAVGGFFAVSLVLLICWCVNKKNSVEPDTTTPVLATMVMSVLSGGNA